MELQNKFPLTAIVGAYLAPDVRQKPSVSHNPGLRRMAPALKTLGGTGGSEVPYQKAKANSKEADVGPGSPGVRGGLGGWGLKSWALGIRQNRIEFLGLSPPNCTSEHVIQDLKTSFSSSEKQG